MKTILTTLLLLVLAGSATAQDSTAKLITAAARKVCDCMMSKKSANVTVTEMHQLAGECISTTALSDFMAIAEARNVEMTDQKGLEKIGVEIGMALARIQCPLLAEIRKPQATPKRADTGTDKEVIDPSELPPPMERIEDTRIAVVESTAGTVIRTEGREVLTLVVKDESGREQRLLLLHPVQGSDKITGNLPAVKGKKLAFTWIEKKLFDPVTAKFRTVKVIAGIQ
ncbi:hypothetical protein [Flaviaesturariibacter amylovorans]